MFQALFKKGLHLSLTNIWRNKFLSLATIFVIGVILFIFNIILSVNFIAQKSLYELGQKVDLIVYLNDTTTEADAQNLISEIKTLPVVSDVTYTSKEQAIEDLKATHPDLSLSFEKYDLENPLPASLSISTASPTDHQEVSDFLNKPQYQNFLSTVSIGDTSDNSIISGISKNISALGRFTNQIIFWLIITFLVGGTLIILNALQIAIYARRKEIEVMKLVGASLWFIRMPFIIEATIYAVMATLLGFLMLFLLAQKTDISVAASWTNIFFIELSLTIFISVTSSLIAVHEHLFRKSL